jgi:aminocarboxymuconate-semialdehyde decarboxylase
VMVAPNFLERNLDDPSLEPLWTVAEQLDQPVLVHPYAPQVGFRLQRYNLSQAVGNPMDTTIAAGSLVFGGVADRHPNLKIILVHGGGFFPYQIGRFQRVYEVTPEARAHAQQPPLDYLRWFYYDTMLLFAPAVRYLAETVGGERVLLGSDYPFDVGDSDPVRVVREARLDATTERQVLSDTCCGLFRLA